MVGGGEWGEEGRECARLPPVEPLCAALYLQRHYVPSQAASRPRPYLQCEALVVSAQLVPLNLAGDQL